MSETNETPTPTPGEVLAKTYRKKPVDIKAIQFDGTYTRWNAIKSAFPDIQETRISGHPGRDTIDYLRIATLEDGHVVSKGDFIIRGVKGGYYPCKPDIFAVTYDDVPLPSPQPAPTSPETPSLLPANTWASGEAASLSVNGEPQRSASGGAAFDFLAHYVRQMRFSEATFGPGRRTKGVADHIRKELEEVIASDGSPKEWVDVVILALDGFWRSILGSMPATMRNCQEVARLASEEIIMKQEKNEKRKWPDWRTQSPHKAIEHDRSAELSAASPVSRLWYCASCRDWKPSTEHAGDLLCVCGYILASFRDQPAPEGEKRKE